MDMNSGTSEKSTRNPTGLTAFVLLAVVAGLVLAIAIPASGSLDSIVNFMGRWFFAIFCTLFAVVQLRVYATRRHEEAHIAPYLPVSVFGVFSFIWVALAVAAIAYGYFAPSGWWEKAGWVVIVSVICVELFVLGKLLSTRTSQQ
jgi:fatty acid desaturase